MSRTHGVTDEQLADLGRYRDSTAFGTEEKLVLAYAEAMTETPVEVPDALFAQLRGRFSDAQIVELSASIAWENYRARFNHALGMEAQGFAEGAACSVPESSLNNPAVTVQ